MKVLVAPVRIPLVELDYGLFLMYPNGAPSRSVEIKRHDAEFEDVLSEMIRQFRPRIDLPLSPQDCFAYCEERAVPNRSQAVDLAALHAFSGNERRARYWAERFHQEDQRRPGSDPEGERFIQELLTRLERGEARDWLQQIGMQNLEKLELPAREDK